MEVPSLPQLHLYTSFLESWGVNHCLSSADYPQSNGRAELGFKESKRIIIDSTSHNGSLNNASVAGPFRRFSMCVWQNTCANSVRRAMVCDVYFPFSKTL